MKYIRTLTMTVTIVFLLIGIGCELFKPNGPPNGNGGAPPPPPGPTRAEQWEHFVNNANLLGLKVVDVNESQHWLKEHSDKISIPDKIHFPQMHSVDEYGIIMTTDHNGKHRILSNVWPLPSDFYGFMAEQESIEWLEAQGYTVEKNNDGYRLKKEDVDVSENVKVIFSQDVQIGWNSAMLGYEIGEHRVMIITNKDLGLRVNRQ